MAVGRPRAVGVFLNIMAGINLIHFVWQITGNGFHHVAERDQPFNRTKLIHHKGKVRSCISELLKGREQLQSFREDQGLAYQGAQIERLPVQLLLEQVDNVHDAQ